MRFFVTATAAFVTVTGAVSAEPTNKASKQPASQADSQPHPARLVLASAEPVGSAAASSSTNAKRRITPRVTTCRCGAQPTPSETEGQ